MSLRPRTVLPALALALAVLTAACGGPRAASGDVATGPGGPDAVRVVAEDNAFRPTALDLEPGATVTLEVANEGGTPHNLVIDDLDLSTGTLQPGEVVTATITVPDAPVDYVCTFHPGMTGRLTPAAATNG